MKRVLSLLIGAAPLLAPAPPFCMPHLPAIPMPVEELIYEAAASEGLRPGFAIGIAWRESKFHADAISDEGAMGLFQVMPETARALGLDHPFDPIENTRVAVHYLKTLLLRYGSEALADCVYGHGLAACH